MSRLLSFLFCIGLACNAIHAQTTVEEKEDSTIINLRNEFLEVTPKEASLSSSDNTNLDLPQLESALDIPKLNWQAQPSYALPSLPHWKSGYIYGYNSSQSNMLLGGIYNSGVSINQSLGRYWTVSSGIDVTKYGVAYNRASFNGSIVYHPCNNFSVTMFGSYSPGSFFSTMQVGQAWYAGGYISLETDNHWGIDLGASHSYDAFYGHETTPIIRPYYKTGGGAKIGFDFGPMLKGYMNKNGRSNSMEFNPVMPRPLNGLPPVAPRK